MRLERWGARFLTLIASLSLAASQSSNSNNLVGQMQLALLQWYCAGYDDRSTADRSLLYPCINYVNMLRLRAAGSIEERTTLLKERERADKLGIRSTNETNRMAAVERTRIDYTELRNRYCAMGENLTIQGYESERMEGSPPPSASLRISRAFLCAHRELALLYAALQLPNIAASCC